MRIPLNYNLRNLAARRTTTIMTALGISLTVAVLLAALALVDGLRTAFASSGNPLNLLVLRKGSAAELSSTITQEIYRDLLFKEGIGTQVGEPLVSLELVTVVTLPRNDKPAGANVTLRGLLPVGIALRDVKLQDGRWFQPGQREVVVGSSVARRFPDAHVGSRLRFGHDEWDVVGVMNAGQSAMNSEILADLNQVSTDFNRRGQYNSVLVGAANVASVPGLADSLNNDQRLNVTALPEKEYYERQTAAGAPMLNLGIVVSVIMAIGSSFAATNTMFAAVARRGKEIGTLRVLGFSRRSILLSFLIESLLLAGLGGSVGCVLTLPLNRVTTAIGNFTTLSETAFRFHVGLSSVAAGIAFALVMGAAGGYFPARMAAKKEILQALREA